VCLFDRLGLAAMHRQIVRARGDGFAIAAFGGEQHPRLVDVGKQRDAVVAAPGGGLVDSDPGHLAAPMTRHPRSTG
jgi:hypothetical protein